MFLNNENLFYVEVEREKHSSLIAHVYYDVTEKVRNIFGEDIVLSAKQWIVEIYEYGVDDYKQSEIAKAICKIEGSPQIDLENGRVTVLFTNMGEVEFSASEWGSISRA